MPTPTPLGTGPGTSASRLRDLLGQWRRYERRAVIFDFNGTLSDDEGILQEIFADIFAASLGWELTPADYQQRFAGHSDREILEMVLTEHGRHDPAVVDELLARRRELYRRRVADSSPVTPGAVGLVQRLSAEEVPLAIVTGAQRADVECVLASCAIGGLIGPVVTEEDVARGKPHPEGFLRGADLLGVPPEAVLVFEDSVPGVTAARAAGMPCVAVAGDAASPEIARIAGATVRALDPSLLDLG